MRILALSDTHFGLKCGRTPEARKDFSNYNFSTFSRVLDIAKEEDIDLILHGGDVFNRSNPTKDIISKVYKMIEDKIGNDLNLIAIPGNHDKSKLRPALMNHFYTNISLINKFSIIPFQEIQIIAFPFLSQNIIPTYQKVKKIMLQQPQTKFIVLSHQLYEGATFGPHNHVFTSKPDVIDTTHYPSNGLLFLSGHIHRSQLLSKGKVIYTGSIIRTSFMEIVEPKGFFIISIEDDYVEVSFKELESFPMIVEEIDITNIGSMRTVVEQIDPPINVRYLLRLTGRSLELGETRYLWANFPSEEYPYFSLSPKKEDIQLKPLYKNEKEQILSILNR